MPAEPLESSGANNSRRSFLVKLGLGAAVLAGLSTPLAGLFRSKVTQQASFDGPPDFPEDSIFHPDPERYPSVRRQRL